MHFYEDLPLQTKKYARPLAVLFLAGFTLGAFAFAFSFFISGLNALKSGPPLGERQLTFTGEGKVAAKPDVLKFTVGVVTTGESVEAAQLEHTRRSNAAAEFVKNEGIQERDIKSISYSIEPQYRSAFPPPCFPGPCPVSSSVPSIIGYRIQSAFEVRVRDFKRIDAILSGVVKNGANEVHSVLFTIDDESSAMAEARQKAIEEARAKARVVAKELGVRLGRVVGFSESSSGFPIFGRGVQAMALEAAAVGPKMEPGEQEIRANVAVTYEFR